MSIIKNGGDFEKANNAILAILSNPLKLTSIAKDLIKYDQKNNTNTY